MVPRNSGALTCGLWFGFRYNLSARSGSLSGHPQISSETATPMPRASGRSPRGGDRHGTTRTYLPACPVCGVIRVDFQHPNWGVHYLIIINDINSTQNAIKHTYTATYNNENVLSINSTFRAYSVPHQ